MASVTDMQLYLAAKKPKPRHSPLTAVARNKQSGLRVLLQAILPNEGQKP